MNLTVRTPVRIDVPEDAFACDEPLVAVMRGSYVGGLHRGTVAVADTAGNLVLSIGEARQPAFLRSAAKPFQVMPAVLSGGIEHFGITRRELAVLCASHSAEPRHLEAVLSVLSKLGLDESALRCGAHPPLDEATARRRWRHGIEPTPVCNNCSGAHAGMLLACRARGWPMEDYTEPDHPLQRAIRETLAVFAAVDPKSVEFVVDNCAVPTFRLPLFRAAVAFARLVRPTGLPQTMQEAAERITAAMTGHPEMVGGTNRFDTDLMRWGAGSILAKGGAEGFQGVGIVPHGLGLALKISDGGSRAVPPVVVRVLDRLDVLADVPSEALDQYREPEVRNLQGALVGRIRPIFDLGGYP